MIWPTCVNKGINMNPKVATLILAISALFSSWLYWGSDLKIEQILTAQEWQSKMVTVVKRSQQNDSVGPIRRVDVNSNVKYLPNGTYIRMSNVKLFAVGGESESFINISETGIWDISDSYLLISPSEFKNISSSQSKDFTPEQLELITQFFKMDAQQSRRIDVVNEKTLLLTSLSHGSTVLFIN
ncbi:MAG: regulatory protein ToxS [Vibrio anguillarum]